MAIITNIVTAQKNLDGYKTHVPATVNDDEVDVQTDAKNTYNAIMADYAQIKKSFERLATQLTKTKSKVKGSKLKNNLDKASKKVSNQATYCSNRSKELESAFEFAEVESRVKDLEEKLATATEKANSEGQ